jgi:hypothetical protein
MIDPESVRQEVVRRLPAHVRWLVRGVPWDFDFSRSRVPLRPIAPTDLNGCNIEDEWTTLYIFGQEDYADGGGASPYLGVHLDTGEICGLDVERDESQVFILNSNVDRFIRTFQKIDEMLRHTPVAPEVLFRALTGIDPDAFQHSEWRDASSYIEADTYKSLQATHPDCNRAD